jgi:hypothetical protein
VMAKERPPRTAGPPRGQFGLRPRAPKAAWRDAVSERVSGCGYVTCLIVMVPVAGIGVILVYLGIGVVAERILRWADGQPIVLGLVGVGIILLSAWAVGRLLTRGPSTGLPRRQLFGAGVVFVVIGLVGLLVLWTAVTNKPGAPGF